MNKQELGFATAIIVTQASGEIDLTVDNKYRCNQIVFLQDDTAVQARWTNGETVTIAGDDYQTGLSQSGEYTPAVTGNSIAGDAGSEYWGNYDKLQVTAGVAQVWLIPA